MHKNKVITVEYFAILKEQRGVNAETIETAAVTPQELYEQLRSCYSFTLSCEQLKVAVNNEFASWQQPLQHGDKIVFLPPVAGGSYP